ncbi:MAG: type I methionyl aminopeptidase [Alphaproteobacteria bacterium]|nr:MAG: type I methionyl aminopeptidase [Alphaproteobacteria bacterium]
MSYFDHAGKQVRIHTKAEFEKMHQAGQLAAETLDFITPHVVPGVSTDYLNELCHEFIIDHGAVPAPLNYRGFPKSICTSVNHVICHGIPGPKVLKDGDSLNIDVTVILDGWYGDTSRMFYVGKPTIKAQKLIETTYECLMDAIAIVKPGVTLGDIGHVIQSKAEKKGYSIVREFCGHGLGQVFHTAPEVLHYGKPGTGMKLAAGMFFTIEPMINIGKPDLRMLADDWTAVTRDKSLSAQFEHSIGVTETGCEIFTLSPKGWHCPPYKS